MTSTWESNYDMTEEHSYEGMHQSAHECSYENEVLELETIDEEIEIESANMQRTYGSNDLKPGERFNVKIPPLFDGRGTWLASE